MKKMVVMTLLAMSVILVSACASRYDEFNHMMSARWSGHSADSVIRQLGKPVATKTNHLGEKYMVYQWDMGRGYSPGSTQSVPIGRYSGTSSGSVFGGGGVGYYGSSHSGTVYQNVYTPGYSYTATCTANFWLDSQDRVVSVRIASAKLFLATNYCEYMVPDDYEIPESAR